MSRLNAIRLTDSLRSRLVDFCLAHNHLRDEELREVCRRFWSGHPENGGLASELWVEGSIPHLSSGESLFDMVDRGQFSTRLAQHLEERGVFTRDMVLHAHQKDAIEASVTLTNPAIVVSAGTGAGKTESFLLPILNDLFENRSKKRDGCRAIIMLSLIHI